MPNSWDYPGAERNERGPQSSFRPPLLTSAQREEIRQRYADGETAKALALAFGVSRSTIQHYTEARHPGVHQ